MAKILKEPLLHFLLVGALFFIADRILHPQGDENNSNVITISEKEIAPSIETFKRNYDREPSEKELKELVDLYLLKEIFYREAIALKINENDPAVKWLLAQRYEEFIKEQVNAYSPGEDSLKTLLSKFTFEANSMSEEEINAVLLEHWKKEHWTELKEDMVNKVKEKYVVEANSEKLKKLLELQ